MSLPSKNNLYHSFQNFSLHFLILYFPLICVKSLDFPHSLQSYWGILYTFFSVTDRTSRQNISKDIKGLKNMICKLNLIAMYRTLSPKLQITHSVQIYMESLLTLNHILLKLGHKANLNMFKRIEIRICSLIIRHSAQNQQQKDY